MTKSIVKSVKMVFSMLRYSMQIKTNIALLIIFTLLGILYEIMSVFGGKEISFYNGAWMLALAPMYSVQLLYSTLMAGVIQSSGIRKLITVDGALIMKEIFTVLGFIFIAVFRYLNFRFNTECGDEVLAGIIFYGIFTIVLSLYTLIAYRYLYVGYLVLLPILVLLMILQVFSDRIFKTAVTPGSSFLSLLNISGNFPACLLIGVALIVIDAVLFYVLSRALYKVPLDERAFKRLLARAK